MKKVFTAPSRISCDFFRTLLDTAGIFSVMMNEGGSSAAGQSLPVPGGSELVWAWPEVWVGDDDFEAASEIAADFQTKRSEKEEVETTQPPGEPNAG